MNWKAFFETSDIKILFYLYDKHESRYSELERDVVKTRSVLSVTLRDLSQRKLIDRTVETTKPIQTRYKLTEKGIKLVQLLANIQKIIL